MSETMDEELARLVYEELIVEFPEYKALPEAMAKALIRLGVNNGIRFSTVNTDKLSVEKLQEQLNTAKKALTEIAEFDCSDDCYFTARDALAAIGGDDD
ncbi:hypothetical protein [Lactococcus lactis]|uniref:hypothetical protein n=1 Tax=Lactococcus lactis TaxID=1358 RepID=UPI00210B8AD2|nr:hypothetical protein [Lactococcus lactis]MCQ4972363.1 hypothetical protein [Lactococcus lactis]MCQ4998169.1 hypothetical protein [Lactococcus lactis]